MGLWRSGGYLPKKRGNLWNERFINIPSQSSLLLFFLPFLTRWLSMCSSYGIPLLLLHVTIEGRPHSSARELRGDGLKITPKDGMKEIVEQPKQKEGQDFFQDSQNLYTTSWVTKVKFVFWWRTIALFLWCTIRIYGIIFLLMTNIMCLIISTMSGVFPSIFSNLG